MGLPVDLAAHGGPGEMTIRRIESGSTESIRLATKANLESALELRPGTIDRVLDGTASDEDLSERVPRVYANPPRTQVSALGAALRDAGLDFERELSGPRAALRSLGHAITEMDSTSSSTAAADEVVATAIASASRRERVEHHLGRLISELSDANRQEPDFYGDEGRAAFRASGARSS